MSSALAIAGVTAVLRDLLNDGLVNGNVAGTIGSTVTVSTLPPDRLGSGNNNAEATQLNLFLHQVTPNPSWRNMGLPARDPADANRRANPPLALDLHYLLSAHGAEDLHAEILLGYAMQLLHETPVLRRAVVRKALDPGPGISDTLPPALRALADCGLADQVEQVRIQPSAIGGEEMWRIWSALQAHYRPTAAYVASVVLIEAQAPVRAPFPVLRRNIDVRPAVAPATLTLSGVTGPANVPAAALGEAMTLAGSALSPEPVTALAEFTRFAVREALPLAPGDTPDQRRLTIPVARAADFPVGLYTLWLHAADGRTSNRMGFVLQPKITGLPAGPIARNGDGDAVVAVDFVPAARKGQQVALIVDDVEVPAPDFAAPVQSLAFVVPDAVPGAHRVRLRIDGFDSEIVDRSTDPPTFLASAEVAIA